MKESVVVILPLPPATLNPNNKGSSRGARMRASRVSRGYRAWARRAAEEQGVESGPWERATVAATFYHKVRRRRDDVNHLAMLKPAYDGLVDAGLLADDDADHLTTLPAKFEIDRECPRVELLLERLK